MMWWEFNKAEPGSITCKPESPSAAVSLAWMQTLHEKKSTGLYLKYYSRLVHNSERKKELYWGKELILAAFPRIKSCNLALSLCHVSTYCWKRWESTERSELWETEGTSNDYFEKMWSLFLLQSTCRNIHLLSLVKRGKLCFLWVSRHLDRPEVHI